MWHVCLFVFIVHENLFLLDNKGEQGKENKEDKKDDKKDENKSTGSEQKPGNENKPQQKPVASRPIAGTGILNTASN